MKLINLLTLSSDLEVPLLLVHRKMSPWIPDSAVKTLANNIGEIIKDKPHLIDDDVLKSLQELKAQLEMYQRLLLNFIDIDTRHDDWNDRRWPEFFATDNPISLIDVWEVRKTVHEVTDVVDHVYHCCCNRRSVLDLVFFNIVQCCSNGSDWVFFTNSKSTRYQISEAKSRIQIASDKVRFLNEAIMENGYDQVLQTTHDDQTIVNLDLPPINFSTAPTVREEREIGLDGAAVELVALLTTGAEHLECISIVAILPGMGKTTLARMVYNDGEVQRQYKTRSFVSISSVYDTKECLLRILNSFARSSDGVAEKMDVDQLKKHVRQKLEGNQYLIVLDNAWTHEMDTLKDAFPDNRGKRCRVLATIETSVREKPSEEDVIRRDPYVFAYRMEFLSLESSRELLRWKIFGESYCPMELQEYERNLAMICDGYPLALLSVAAMIMKHRNRVEWWKRVVYNLRNFRGKEPGHLFKPMNYAYMHLPNHLKPCFLYFAVFQKGTDISVWKLVRLWIAEGFIVGCPHNLEDVAEQYLEELVNLNFVMVSKRRSNGRIGMCKMNNMFHDFCKETTAHEKFIMTLFVTAVKHRIVSLERHSNILDSPADSIKVVRSLLMSVLSEVELNKTTVSCLMKRFKLLKVLDAGFLFFACSPVQIGYLVLLKYIAFRGRIESLPSTLSDLWSLQTLIVNTTSPTLEIKADIWKMPHFRHLHTNASTSFPCQVTSESHENEECDSNVQTLSYISPKSYKNEVFNRTTKLKKLGISGTLAELFESNSLKYLHKLEYLENLKLLNRNNSPGLPPKISFPKQLTKITLSNTRLCWKEMHSTIGEMENLEILKLKEYAFVGEWWKTENGGFLRLKHLHIGRIDLMVWEASAEHLPQLRRLEISECDGLRRVPHDLADISSLESVSLHRSTSPGVTYSLKRIRLVKFLQAKQADQRKVFQISVYPPED